jgi:hypothetical protein
MSVDAPMVCTIFCSLMIKKTKLKVLAFSFESAC